MNGRIATAAGAALLVCGILGFAATSFAAEKVDLESLGNLFSTDEEKKMMVVNPASRKKEADLCRPANASDEKECAKAMGMLTGKFGAPARFRIYYGTYVYVWRFEGGEWLSVGVETSGNLGGDPLAFFHWEWRKPELSALTEGELTLREFPPVQIDKEGLPPAAFFEFFNPYSGFNDESPDLNFVTEFNASNYLKQIFPRYTAEKTGTDGTYMIWTKEPDTLRGEISKPEGGDGKHKDECRVGLLEFRKVGDNFYLCEAKFFIDGSMGFDSGTYLFETYDRYLLSAKLEKSEKVKMVRYLGTVTMDMLRKMRKARGGAAVSGDGRVATKK